MIEYILKDNLEQLSSSPASSKPQTVNFLIEVSSDIPIGAGLGSSAAYSIALSTAIYLGLHIFLGTQGSLDQTHVKSKAQ